MIGFILPLRDENYDLRASDATVAETNLGMNAGCRTRCACGVAARDRANQQSLAISYARTIGRSRGVAARQRQPIGKITPERTFSLSSRCQARTSPSFVMNQGAQKSAANRRCAQISSSMEGSAALIDRRPGKTLNVAKAASRFVDIASKMSSPSGKIGLICSYAPRARCKAKAGLPTAREAHGRRAEAASKAQAGARSDVDETGRFCLDDRHPPVAGM